MTFPKLKLAHRLALSFGAVIILMLLIMSISILGFSAFRETTEQAIQQEYPKSILVNQFINDLETIARAMRNTLFLQDEQQINQQLQEITSTNLKLKTALQQMHEQANDLEAKAIMHEIDIVDSAYTVNQEDFVNLVSHRQMSEAKNLLLVDLHPYQQQYFDLLKKLNAHQSSLMANASNKVARVYQRTRSSMIALFVLSLLLSLYISMKISRSLLKQLGGEPGYATAIARQIAQGELHCDIQLQPGDQFSLLAVMRQMRDRLNERTDALEEANAELLAMVETLKCTQADLVASEKMAALGSLVAGIAHELNTPIGNGVTTASSMRDFTSEFIQEAEQNALKRSHLESYLKEMQQGTEILYRNLIRAGDLVASFKQVAVDRETTQLRDFDLQEVLNEILLTLRPMIRSHQVDVEVRIPQTIRMRSYPGPLGQVITNLISNAIVHGFEQQAGGRIVISAELESDSWVSISVQDNGLGISADNLPHIFEPFFTTKMGRGGTGLGLHIVYNIVVNVLQGKISASSHAGQGAVFQVRIPARMDFS